MTKKIKNTKHNETKKWFIVSLIIWLGALPITILFQYIFGTVITNIGLGESLQAVTMTLNIISLLLGMYFFVGWIPALIFGIKMSKK